MKKSKILVVGLIALLMAGGLVLAGCDEDGKKCPGGGSCVGQTDANGRTIQAKRCSNSDCAVSKQEGIVAQPNLNVHCDCK